MSQETNRILFLDHLRAFVIVCVVVLHGSITYMDYAPAWWYVVNPRHATFFRYVVVLLDVPIMMVMFFIAAYFLLPSLLKRDQKTFLKDKFARIGAPWIAGVLLLAPPTAYIAFYTRHVPVPLSRYWLADFWTPANYQQSVYWFLGILLFFFLVFSVAYRSSRRLRSLSRRISRPSWKMFVTFWAIMTLAMFLMLNAWLPDSWFNNWYLLSFQPVRAPLYTGYFILGIIAWRDGWFASGGYRPRLLPWAALWVLSGLLYLGNQTGALRIPAQSPAIARAMYAALFNAFCLSSLMAGCAFFQRYLNDGGRFLKSLSASSYGIYYIHPLILYPIAYFFITIPLPLYLKAATVIGSTLLLSWTVSALVLRKAPVLREVF